MMFLFDEGMDMYIYVEREREREREREKPNRVCIVISDL
jgi:hypothetical protein